jgi:hypothetical protein
VTTSCCVRDQRWSWDLDERCHATSLVMNLFDRITRVDIFSQIPESLRQVDSRKMERLGDLMFRPDESAQKPLVWRLSDKLFESRW